MRQGLGSYGVYMYIGWVRARTIVRVEFEFESDDMKTREGKRSDARPQPLTAFASSLYVSGLLTTFLASRVTAGRGRRASMVLGGAAFLAGVAVGGASVNIYMVILGRSQILKYLSPGRGARVRQPGRAAVPVGDGAGAAPWRLQQRLPAQRGHRCARRQRDQLRHGEDQRRVGWRVLLALAAVPAGLLTLGALFLPETPNSLLLQRIRGAELDDIVAASSTATEGDGLRRILFERRYRPELAMAVATPFFQQVTGINAIAFYAPVLLHTIGMGESASLRSAVVTGVVAVGSTFASMLAVERFGCRTLFLVGGAQVLIGGIMAVELRERPEQGAGVLILLIAIYVAGFGWSWAPLGWLVLSEIFPLEVRAAGQSITVAAWLAAMTAFVYLLLPETKGVPIEQVAGVWRAHWLCVILRSCLCECVQETKNQDALNSETLRPCSVRKKSRRLKGNLTSKGLDSLQSPPKPDQPNKS
ncbi:LOW QUALITY PROTEIN: hypothetical protein U9M48_006764 [Paspalum notatum var. saurae]|uniref:Major facilitator superfamily (MFS) profile domain-containing protein n=1 Tax=Paspalum notatum var. saurae TaxID=547442 RepID=A0AAQ3PZD2_PASNO